MKRSALGKGLDALIPGATSFLDAKGTAAEADRQTVVKIPVAKIKPSPFQPRMSFNPEKLDNLISSISERGVIQPVLVRVVDDGYELLVGERRLRAVQKLGYASIPAIVYESASNEEAIALGLIENIQREDLNPIEEANAYRRLMTECNLSQTEVAARVGKDRSSVANFIRLLSLPEEVQRMLVDGRLSAGHGRVLLAVPADSQKIAMARRAVANRWSVRDIERAVYADKVTRRKRQKTRSPEIASIEENLKRKLQTKVSIVEGRQGGKIIIEYYSNDEFNRLLETLGVLDRL